jgi:hypothetical protein
LSRVEQDHAGAPLVRCHLLLVVEFDGWALVADQLTHTVVPIMTVVGWLMYGPRGQASWPVIRFYPYRFHRRDVARLRQGRRERLLIALLFLAAAAGYRTLDRWLGREPVC